MLMQYNSHHCWMKGSMQTRLINTQIWTFSIIMVVNVFSSFAIWKISALKMLWQDKKKVQERKKGGGKKTGNLWFCGIFSNIGSRPGPIPWLHLCPRECFPCQHTFLTVAEHSVSCGFGSWHPGPGRAWFRFYQCWARSRQFCGGAASSLSRGPRFQASWIKLHRHSAHHKCTVIDMVLVVPAYTNSSVSYGKQWEEINRHFGGLEGVCIHLNDQSSVQWEAFDHVLLLCLCCMGACYDWNGLLVQDGLLLGLCQERQHFKYSISSRFIVTGIELHGVWSAARGQLRVIVAFGHLGHRMQWNK